MVSSLDNKNWEEFFIEEVAEIVSGRDIYETERIPGNTPYISSTAQNNGISYLVGNENATIEENCLSVNRNGSVGFSFFHPYKALFSNDCRKLRPLVNSKYVGLFLANQITRQKEKYNYGYKMGTGRIKRQKIMLPAAKNKPDYSFIEKFVRELIEDKRNRYIDYSQRRLETINYEEIPDLNEKSWHEFFIKDLFPEVQRGKRLTKANQIEGNKPYVSSTALNNGVDEFIGNDLGVRTFSNCLTIANSGSVGATFYHPYEFVASDHVTHLKNNSFSFFVYMFIATQLNKISEKYNFNREINDTRIAREKINLPVNSKGLPDYKFMAQYMMNIEYQKRQQYLKFLSDSD